MSFGVELAKIRFMMQMTQKDFAKKIGSSATTMNNWETGKTLPQTKLWQKLFSFIDETGYKEKAFALENAYVNEKVEKKIKNF